MPAAGVVKFKPATQGRQPRHRWRPCSRPL